MSTTVLSIRIRRELKEEAERLGIDIRAVVEKALEEEIRRAKLAKFRRVIEEALKSMDIPIDEWVRTVKETRFER